MGFTALGAACGITPDGKVIAFAGNRGKGDGIFLSIDHGAAARRIVRIVGENSVTQKAELGVDGAGNNLFFSSIDLDSRVGVVYTPDIDGVPDKSAVVSFIGTPNAASRTNPGNGKPFLFSAQKGLWTMRADLDAPLFEKVCLVRAPGVTGNPFTLLGDDLVVVTNGTAFPGRLGNRPRARSCRDPREASTRARRDAQACAILCGGASYPQRRCRRHPAPRRCGHPVRYQRPIPLTQHGHRPAEGRQ